MRAVGAARLFLRQARADAPVLVTLAVLVLVTALLAAAVPRQLNSTADAAVRQALDSAPDPAREITAGSINSDPATQLREVDTRLTNRMTAALSGVTGTGAFGTTTGRYDSRDPVTLRPFRAQPFAWLQLRYQSDLLGKVRWAQGRAPEQSNPTRTPDDSASRLEIALDQRVARSLDMAVGDRILLAPLDDSGYGPRILVEVTGLFQPMDRTEPAWGYDDLVLTPGRELDSQGNVVAEYATALVTGRQLGELSRATLSLSFDWHYPVRTDLVDATNVSAVLAGVERATAQGLSLSPSSQVTLGVPLSVDVTSGLLELFGDYLAQAATAEAVASLVLAGLFVLALSVLGLATQLSVQRRREALALARARGASTAQLIGIVALEAFLVAAPSGAAGYALAVLLVPARPAALSAVLVAALVVGCVVFVSLGSWRAGRTAATDRREDVVGAPGSRRRTAAEALIVLLGIGGLVLLRRRGVGASTDGGDPFLATVPVLLALGVGVLALRAYPWLLRPLVSLVGRRAGAVSFVSLARAARQPFATTLPLVVLLLGLGFSVFASTVETTITRGQQDNAWGTVGADYRLMSFAPLGGQRRQVAAIDGVFGTVAAFAPDQSELVQEGGQRLPIRFLALDPAAYDELTGDAPAGVVPRAGLDALAAQQDPRGALPALVSPGVAAQVVAGAETVDLGTSVGDVDISVRAVADRFPTDGGEDFVVVDRAAMSVFTETPIRPTEVFVRAPASVATAIAEAAAGLGQGVVVDDRAEILADIARTPLVGGTVALFRLGTAAAAGYCFLAVLLALVLSARARTRLLAALRTLGIRRRQARALIALELAPMVAVVVLTGLAVGVTLPYLLLPAVDLTPFTAGPDPPALEVEPLVAGLLALGLVAVVAAAALVMTAIERRRRLGEAVRIGEA